MQSLQQWGMDKSHDQNFLGCAHYVSKVENLNKAKSLKTLLSSVGQISHEKHGESHYKQTLALRGEQGGIFLSKVARILQGSLKLSGEVLSKNHALLSRF